MGRRASCIGREMRQSHRFMPSVTWKRDPPRPRCLRWQCASSKCPSWLRVLRLRASRPGRHARAIAGCGPLPLPRALPRHTVCGASPEKLREGPSINSGESWAVVFRPKDDATRPERPPNSGRKTPQLDPTQSQLQSSPPRVATWLDRLTGISRPELGGGHYSRAGHYSHQSFLPVAPPSPPCSSA